MLDLSNPGKLPLQDLPDDIAVGMVMAWRNGALVYWHDSTLPQTMSVFGVYRIRPAKQLIAPWEWLAPWINAVAMAPDSRIYGMEQPPVQTSHDRNGWFFVGIGRSSELSHLIKFDTVGIDWRNSLTPRPEGK